MRAVALHADVIVFVSRAWQTTSTAVRAGEEGFLIDSPVYPDELAALPGRAGAGGLSRVGAAGDPRRLGSPARTAGVPGALAGLRRVDRRAAARRSSATPSASSGASTKSTTSRAAAAARSARAGAPGARPAVGSAPSGSSSCTRPRPHGRRDRVSGCRGWDPRRAATTSRRSRSRCSRRGARWRRYRATLQRLEPLVEAATTVVPGHGAPLPGTGAENLSGRPRIPERTRASRLRSSSARRSPNGAQRAIHGGT